MNGTPAKKRWAFVLLFFMFYTLFLPVFEITGGNFERVLAVEEHFAGGSGTWDDPWVIETAEQLNNVRNYLGSENQGRSFQLGMDIDLGQTPWNEDQGWEPIGSWPEQFHGSFDGNHKTISGLTISRPTEEYIGLFGRVDHGRIKDLTLANVDIEGHSDVGSVVGYNSLGVIENIKADGVIVGNGSNIGGLVGFNYNAPEWNRNSKVSNSHSEVDVTASSSNNVGGVVGGSNKGTVSYSSSKGTIVGQSYVGGLVGDNGYGSQISKSYFSGNVEGYSFVGGLAGIHQYSYARSISDSYSTGNVSGDQHVGGLAGTVRSESHIQRSYAAGAVTGNASTGGLVGSIEDWNQPSRIEASYWDKERTNQQSSAGSDSENGKTTAEMKEGSTFEGWIYGDIWTINPLDNSGYPALAWQGFNNEFSYFAGGDGSPEDPYQIADAEQLDQVRNYLDSHFILTGDINLDVAHYNTGEGWTPIGNKNESEAFTGSFDGNGYTISNLMINKIGVGNTGLFSYADGGEFKNIKLRHADVKSNSYNTGILLGEGQRVALYNVHAEGIVIGYYNVGGLIGQLMHGDVQRCSADVKIYPTEHSAGGLIGFSNGTDSEPGTIRESFTTGEIVSSNGSIGGLVGTAGRTHIEKSYSMMNVRSTNSYSSNLGGLLGLGHPNTRITDSYSMGDVEGNHYVGGIIGRFSSSLNTKVDRVYSIGRVEGVYYTGGVAGDLNNASVESAYYNQETSGQTDTGKGEPRTTAELTYVPSDNTYQNWDFGGIWTLNGSDNHGYPALAWQGFDNDFSFFSGGDGSEGNPYLISTAEELNRVRNYHAEDVYFKQVADIDLGIGPWNDGEGWEPIGTDYLTRFEGIYDGEGHQILNLTINGTESGNYGLFGVIGSKAEIKNLQLTNGHVLAPNNEGYSSSAGLLVGSSLGGHIDFIEGEGFVSGRNYTGGLIGSAQGGMITDSSFKGSVQGLYGVGGIAGSTWYTGDFMRNYANAAVRGQEAVGGLVGANDLWRLFRNYSSGEVVGEIQVGGLIGMSGGQISAGYSSADVEGGDRVGGLVGLIRYTNGNSPSTVYGSYAVGSVQLSGDNGRIGGLVGEIREEVDTSRQGSVHQSYYDMTTTGQSDEGKGFGGTTEEMFKQSTFEEWDFDELWIINEGKGYPILRIFMVEEKPDDPVEEPAEPGEENEGGDEGEPEDTEEPLEPGEENDDGAEPEDEGAPTESGEETDGVEEEEFVTIPKLGDRGLFWNALLLILGSLVFFATLYQKKRRSKK